jgi:hypothetical protein
VVDVSSPRLTGERRIADFLKTLPVEGESVPGPAPANFVIALHSTPSRPEIATSRSGPMATASAQHTAVLPRRRRWVLGAGAGVAVTVVAVLAVSLRSRPAVSPAPAEEPKPVIAAPAPKPVALKGPQLTVVSEPAGAAAQLDDAAIGPAPQTVSTTPGKHLLRLTLTGYQPAEMPVELKEGDSRELFVPLVRTSRRSGSSSSAASKSSPAPVGGDGYLSLSTEPWTKVAVDGEALGSTPLFRHKLPSGKHELTLVNEGASVHDRRTIRIDPGQTLKLKLAF